VTAALREARALEAFVARLYVDADARARFAREPLREALEAGLSLADAQALCDIDQVGLSLAATSFERKRAHARGHASGLAHRIAQMLRRLCAR